HREWAADRATEQRKRSERRTAARRRRGGKHKLGKILPHTELIRRTLCFDPIQNDAGVNWLPKSPQRRTARALVELFSDYETVADLIERQPRVKLAAVTFDQDAQVLAFTYPDGKTRTVSIDSLPSIIGRLANRSL